MGCDIHCYIEVNVEPFEEAGYKQWNLFVDPRKPIFDGRSYSIFGFLANVRNYSQSPVISQPKGLPRDLSFDVIGIREYTGLDGHSDSFLTLKELLDYDYDQVIWNRRIEGEGTYESLREFLGQWYFDQLDYLKTLDDDPENVRIVFWFDN